MSPTHQGVMERPRLQHELLLLVGLSLLGFTATLIFGAFFPILF
jgi:hypothetical protein